MNYGKTKLITILVITVLAIGVSAGWFFWAGAELEPEDNTDPIAIDQVFEQTFTAQPEIKNQVTNTPCQADKIESIKDIQYRFIDGVKPHQLSLDLYRPADQNCHNWPVMIYVHGGGWQTGDKSEGIQAKIDYFINQGFVLVSINYRPAVGFKYPTPHQDVAAAIAWVGNNIQQYGGNPEDLSLIGFSSGADMVSLLVTNHQFLNDAGINPQNIRCAVILDAGGYNLANIINNNEIYINVFGTTTKILTAASPINYLTADKYFPYFLIVTRGNIQRINDATFFYGKLLATGHSAQLVWADSLPHLEVDEVFGTDEDNVIAPATTDFLKSCR
ncbi:MAG: hypothetical protein A2114_02720 [Candidatus Vogelbacteria bacterium GWA1_51_14]|uniref:BD-FAE-like domain-containing protein n=1 Tax=Candidatus Vogelbacteria bacterium GWA1_51_14 TaxID=1802435 RepID=A0A1G2Q9X4_9BACT|nr:MAG: hypothetical protein A2114_02720 [Candidatus Vogelbacteria bacterium GWA1_51_14]